MDINCYILELTERYRGKIYTKPAGAYFYNNHIRKIGANRLHVSCFIFYNPMVF
jgi:hypothetical protein